MNAASHTFFIVSAYAAAAAIIGVMIAWVLLDHWRQARALADLEARGVTRRSERSERTGEVTT